MVRAQFVLEPSKKIMIHGVIHGSC